MKRIMLVLTVALVMAALLVVMAAPALAGPKGKGDGVGGGDTFNNKDVKAEKTRTGGGPLNNPNVCDIGCT